MSGVEIVYTFFNNYDLFYSDLNLGQCHSGGEIVCFSLPYLMQTELRSEDVTNNHATDLGDTNGMENHAELVSKLFILVPSKPGALCYA